MPTAARRTTTTDTSKTSTPRETPGTEPATGKAPAPSGAAARTGTATRQRPTGSPLTYVAGAPVDPERATGTQRAARSAAAARTGTATPQRPTTVTSAPGATPTTDQAAEQAQQMARAAVEKAAALGSGVAQSVRTVVTLPVTATAAVVDDVVSAVRRPDAVLYGGALVGLAAFGILEWPVAAAVGVGVAVASGVRRART